MDDITVAYRFENAVKRMDCRVILAHSRYGMTGLLSTNENKRLLVAYLQRREKRSRPTTDKNKGKSSNTKAMNEIAYYSGSFLCYRRSIEFASKMYGPSCIIP